MNLAPGKPWFPTTSLPGLNRSFLWISQKLEPQSPGFIQANEESEPSNSLSAPVPF